MNTTSDRSQSSTGVHVSKCALASGVCLVGIILNMKKANVQFIQISRVVAAKDK